MATKIDANRVSIDAGKPPLIIDTAQYDLLAGLAIGAEKRAPELARQLLEEVERAELRPTADVPADVVKLGAAVTFADGATGRTQTVRLTFPAQADVSAGRISVLSPIGAALIGLSVGQSIRWRMEDGSTRELTVLAVDQRPG
ncbi:MAG TPA: nucleoside diphosphate kinase regulator [Gammaproteobacteria bacterium]